MLTLTLHTMWSAVCSTVAPCHFMTALRQSAAEVGQSAGFLDPGDEIRRRGGVRYVGFEEPTWHPWLQHPWLQGKLPGRCGVEDRRTCSNTHVPVHAGATLSLERAGEGDVHHAFPHCSRAGTETPFTAVATASGRPHGSNNFAGQYLPKLHCSHCRGGLGTNCSVISIDDNDAVDIKAFLCQIADDYAVTLEITL